MASNWFSGKPTRHFDGSPTLAQLSANAWEFRGKSAFHNCEMRFNRETVTAIMLRCDSVNRFPDWKQLTAAFERLAACERGDEISIDAAFCGWTDEHAEEDAEAAAVADERAEMRADLYQF